MSSALPQPVRQTRPRRIEERGQFELLERSAGHLERTKVPRPEYQEEIRSEARAPIYTREREVIESTALPNKLVGGVETAVKRLKLVHVKDRASKVNHYIKRLETAINDLRPGGNPRMIIPIDPEDQTDEKMLIMFKNAIGGDVYETVVDGIEYKFYFVVSVEDEENETGLSSYLVVTIESETREI